MQWQNRGRFFGAAAEAMRRLLQLGLVAQWDGQQWQRVGAVGPQGQVRALAWHRGRLYAAGDFAFADNKPARGIAVFDGTAWTEVGAGLSDPPVCALAPGGVVLSRSRTRVRARSVHLGTAE